MDTNVIPSILVIYQTEELNQMSNAIFTFSTFANLVKYSQELINVSYRNESDLHTDYFLGLSSKSLPEDVLPCDITNLSAELVLADNLYEIVSYMCTTYDVATLVVSSDEYYRVNHLADRFLNLTIETV